MQMKNKKKRKKKKIRKRVKKKCRWTLQPLLPIERRLHLREQIKGG